jgi:virulence-associated protein VagC
LVEEPRRNVVARAKIKTSGSDQFVLLPVGFRFATRDVEILREGNELVIREVPSRRGDYQKGRKPSAPRALRALARAVGKD